MNEAEARADLEDMVAAAVFPTLDADQITRLLRGARRVDDNGRLPSEDTEWEPATVYAVGDVIVPTVRNGHAYRVTDAGTSGATEPTWPTTEGGVVTLDGVEYTEDSGTVWVGTYELNSAASKGWRIKAGLVSNRHSFGSNQGNYNPEQVHQHCMAMADHYRDKQVASVVLASGRWSGSGGLPGAHLEDAI